ncbi:phosphotransferase family protein [Sphingosinicella sp.]|uniref:phosphotransferase family protein n=1 Tax=Sphingosinicella sp. TaxID=1917971 RepID=UPI0035B2E860
MAGVQDEAVIEHLRACGLVAPGEVPRMTPLSGGVSCDVWRVDTAKGGLAVKRALPRLRVEADWFAPVERAESEVRWLRRVGAFAPAIVPTIVAEAPEEHLFAMRFLDPAQHPVWKDELIAGRVDPGFAAKVGAALVGIHAATANDPAIARDFDTGAMFHALRVEPFLLHVAQHDADVAPRLGALAADLEARHVALVHGDVSPKNILVGPGGPVFLDAECAVYGDPAFDLAFCTTHLLLKAVWLRPHAAELAASATQMAEAYRAGIAWEDADALMRRAGALTAALLLARVDGKSPAPYLTDAADRTEIRTRAGRLLTGSDADLYAGLETLIGAWRDGGPNGDQ